MRLPGVLAFPLEQRNDSVANATAQLEGPELALTCCVLQGTPGNKKQEKSHLQRSCS